MKKLNNKGFTLIELLAVIVIMAIIVVVTVPTIINSISDARISSIWNLAKSTVNSYDNLYAQNLLKPNSNFIEVTEEWSCITNAQAELLGVSKADVVLQEDAFSMYEDASAIEDLDGFRDLGDGRLVLNENGITSKTCSAMRKNNNETEVLLVAKEGGKFDVSGKYVYALSTRDTGLTNNG